MNELPASIGRYKIVSRIGHGGMGVLFLAFDPMLERQVAIKLLRDDNEELRQRFAREARAVARLRHPHIVTIFDVGEQDGNPFIAMEYLHGQTLADVIRGALAIDVPRKLQLIDELCDGLGYAHKAGIVHRDVKPANIMIDQDGVVKVLDFGIARIAESGMTQAGMLIGTLNYMSPEQVAGEVVDGRSDIFAVGAVLYELLAYCQAFPGGLHSGILNKILHVRPKPLGEICAGLDGEVIRIVDCALEKDPEKRYQDLQAMRKDLQRVRQRLQEELPGTVIVRPPAGESGDVAAPTTPTPRPPHTPRAFSDRDGLARRRAAQTAAHLEQARRAMATGDFDAAVAAAEQALLLNAEEPEALRLLDQVRQALDERQLKEWLARGSDLLQQGHHTEALALAEQALTLAPGSAEALALRRAIDQSIAARNEARQRLDAAQAALQRARDCFEQQAYEEAVREADAALAGSPELPGGAALRARAQDALARQRQSAQARRVANTLTQAAALFSNGKHADAIALLDTCGLDDGRIGEALADMRSRQAQLAAEAARLERERVERDRRDQAVADAIARAGAEPSHQAALAILNESHAIDRTRADVQSLIASRQAALTAEGEEARRAAARQEIAAALARAAAAPSNEAAIAILRQAVAIDPNHAEAKIALDTRVEAQQREQDEARRQAAELGARQARERAEKIAAALAEAAGTPAHDRAIAILQSATALDPENAEIRRAVEARQTALRLEQEETRRAREREARIAAAIASAGKATTHEAAIATLKEAQGLDPTNAQIRSLLDARQASLDQEREQARRDAERRAAVAAAIKQAKAEKSHEAAIALLEQALALDASNRDARSLLESRERALQGERAEAKRAQDVEAARQSIAALIERRDFDAADAALQDADRLQAPKAMKVLHRQLRDARRAAAAAAATPPGARVAGPTARARATIAGVAVVVVAVAGGGYFVAHRSTPSPSPTVSQPTESAPPPGERGPARVDTVPAEPAARGPAPASDPGRAAPEPATPSDSAVAPALETKSRAAIQLARQHLAENDLRQAWAVAAAGISGDPSNPELGRLASDIVSTARQHAAASRAAAAARGALATQSTLYTNAQDRENEGLRQQRARRSEPAVRAFLAAVDLYGQADREAQQRAAAAVPAEPAPRAAPREPPASPPGRPSPVPSERIPPPVESPSPTVTRPPVPPPTPVSTEKPPAPAPAAAAAVRDEDAIRAALAAYAGAQANLDADAVARVYPSVNVDALRRSFADYKSFKVEIDQEQITVAGAEATVSCRVRTTFVPKAGSGRSDVRATTFKLRKAGNQWLIASRQ